MIDFRDWSDGPTPRAFRRAAGIRITTATFSSSLRRSCVHFSSVHCSRAAHLGSDDAFSSEILGLCLRTPENLQ